MKLVQNTKRDFIKDPVLSTIALSRRDTGFNHLVLRGFDWPVSGSRSEELPMNFGNDMLYSREGFDILNTSMALAVIGMVAFIRLIAVALWEGFLEEGWRRD